MALRPTYRDESALLRFIDAKRVNARLSTGWDRAPTRRLWVEGYQARSFDCELGSHFHHGYVFGGPPIMPDGRISQVRFEVLASRPCAFPFVPRFKRWFAYAPTTNGLLSA